MAKKKLKVGVPELVFYIIGGGLALWGLVYIVLGLIANNLPIPTSQNPLKAFDNFIKSTFGLGSLYWGLIIYSIGTVTCVIDAIAASTGADKSYEKEARRASRVNRNSFKKEEPVVEAPVVEAEPVVETKPAEIEEHDEDVKASLESSEEKEEKPDAGMSLSESIAKGLRYKNAILTKHEISSWLGHTYGDKVERNERELSTAPSKGNKKGLPLPDTHYAISEEGEKVCFAFIYELEENHSIFMLLKMNEKCLAEVKNIYPNVALSAFPKSYKEKWYTVFVDETFKSKLDVYSLIEFVYKHVFEQDAISLKASMALAYDTAGFAVSKREVADWLKENYQDIEVNCRDLYTKQVGNRKGLPLPDTHYRVSGDKKVCFCYIYQLDNGNVFMLLKLNPSCFKELKKYCKDVTLSAFPRSTADEKWYTAIIDNSFIDKKQVYHLAEFAYQHVFDK